MSAPQVTIEDLKLARDVLIAFASLLVGMVAFLVRTSYKMGRDAEKVAAAIAAIVPLQQSVTHIPVMSAQIELLQNEYGRMRSDVKHLLRGSRPAMNGED